jgi:hypothetical protein
MRDFFFFDRLMSDLADELERLAGYICKQERAKPISGEQEQSSSLKLPNVHAKKKMCIIIIIINNERLR